MAALSVDRHKHISTSQKHDQHPKEDSSLLACFLSAAPPARNSRHPAVLHITKLVPVSAVICSYWGCQGWAALCSFTPPPAAACWRIPGGPDLQLSLYRSSLHRPTVKELSSFKGCKLSRDV